MKKEKVRIRVTKYLEDERYFVKWFTIPVYKYLPSNKDLKYNL